MRESFEIEWAAVAEDDLLGIVRFIAYDNPEVSLSVLRKIQDRTANLYRSPQRGRIVPELLKHGISRYREVVIAPWRVIHRIEGRKVYLVSVIDGRRNVEDILLARLLN